MEPKNVVSIPTAFISVLVLKFSFRDSVDCSRQIRGIRFQGWAARVSSEDNAPSRVDSQQAPVRRANMTQRKRVHSPLSPVQGSIPLQKLAFTVQTNSPLFIRFPPG